MLKSLRYRLLTWFVFSTLLMVILAITVFQLHAKNKARSRAILDNLEFIQHQFLIDKCLISGFISTDIYTDGFYVDGKSKNLSEHYQLVSNIDSCFVMLHEKVINSAFSYNDNILVLRNSYTGYNILFDSLVYNVHKKGFRNFGLEGKLAYHLQEIEKTQLVSYATIAKLNIYNSNWLLHPDSIYVKHINALLNNAFSNQRYPKDFRKKVFQYKNNFDQIIKLNNKIGIRSNLGLLANLNNTGGQIEKQLSIALSEYKDIARTETARINHVFVLAALLLIVLSLIIGIYTSKYLVNQLELLARYISSLSKSKLNQKPKFKPKKPAIEVQRIYNEFEIILKKLCTLDSQWKVAKSKVKDSQQKYHNLADMLPLAVYETDNLGNLTYANKTWHNTFGYSPIDIEGGINIIEIINSNSPNNPFSYVKVEDNDMIGIKKNRDCFPITVYSDVIKEGLQVIGNRGVVVDASLKYKYFEGLKTEKEKAIIAGNLKSSFLANMSHEIRTPMNSIIGFSNMLSSKDISEGSKENFINHIQYSSEMLLNLVDDIIDVAKIEAGQLKIRQGECSPIYTIKELTENFEAYKTRIDKKHIRLINNLPKKDLPFRTDEFRLQQILSNLISNAIKFTEKGHVEIGLTMKTPQILEFWVEDTGVGMSKEELRIVFDRFESSELSEKKKINGTGLGLTISKNLVELLDGSMYVKSSPQKGTRFSFELPYIRVVENNVGSKKQKIVPIDSYKWSDKTILVVEDDFKGGILLQHLLQETGAEVIHATNGIEAVEATNIYNIDIVLMDILLPKLDGLEATRRIKRRYPYLPIIAQTAYAMDKDKIKCIAAGCDDYITKPIKTDALLAKIAQFISSTPQPSSIENNCLSNVNELNKNIYFSSKKNN